MSIEVKLTKEIFYHFLPNNGRTRYTNELEEVGKTLIYEGELELCKKGLHASRNILSALIYAQGTILCKVTLDNPNKEPNIILEGLDKVCSNYRTPVWIKDIKEELKEFLNICTLRAQMHASAAKEFSTHDDSDANLLAAVISTASVAMDARIVYDVCCVLYGFPEGVSYATPSQEYASNAAAAIVRGIHDFYEEKQQAKQRELVFLEACLLEIIEEGV